VHRPGQYGAGLLFGLPIALALDAGGAPILALGSLVTVVAVTRVPDLDLRSRRLGHRGPTHSLPAALITAALVGAVGWALAPLLPESPVRIAVEFGPDPGGLHPVADGLPPPSTSLWRRSVLATAGFASGAAAIIAHVAADALTPAGVPLWWPVDEERVSLGLVRAGNPIANDGPLVAGATAAVAVMGPGLR
jgi:inner membrane protein